MILLTKVVNIILMLLAIVLIIYGHWVIAVAVIVAWLLASILWEVV